MALFYSSIKYHVVQSLLHLLQLLMGYFIMLAIMSYNGWIGISVAIGNVLLYYFTPMCINITSCNLHVKLRPLIDISYI